MTDIEEAQEAVVWLRKQAVELRMCMESDETPEWNRLHENAADRNDRWAAAIERLVERDDAILRLITRGAGGGADG